MVGDGESEGEGELRAAQVILSTSDLGKSTAGIVSYIPSLSWSRSSIKGDIGAEAGLISCAPIDVLLDTTGLSGGVLLLDPAAIDDHEGIRGVVDAPVMGFRTDPMS